MSALSPCPPEELPPIEEEPDDECWLYKLECDLDEQQRFARRSVLLSDRRLVLSDGAGSVSVRRLADIKAVRIDELYASGCLVLVGHDGDEERVAHYTCNLTEEAAALARIANGIIEGQPPLLTGEQLSATCATCDSPLPARGASCPMCMKQTRVIARLIGLLRPYRLRVVMLMALTAISVFVQMVPPYTCKMITDQVIKAGQVQQLPMWIAVMLGSFAAVLVTRTVANWLNAWLGVRLVADLRERLHWKIQRLGLAFHDRQESGEMVGRVMDDTGRLQNFLVDGMPYLVVNVASFFTIAIILLCIDPVLALFVFLPVPFILGGGRWFLTKLVPMFHQDSHRISRLYSVLQESASGIRAVKASVQEGRRHGEFCESNQEAKDIRLRVEWTFIGFAETMAFIMALGTVGVWYFGAHRIIGASAQLSLGDLVAFVGYMALFYGPLQWFTEIFHWMTRAVAGAERIFQVLDHQSEVYDAPDAVALTEPQGKIEFTNVRFSYTAGKEALRGLSMVVQPGEMIGLVGRSGSGKSTLINLVCRFYDVDSGEIRIDGIPIRKLKLEEWRQQIGIVMQDPFLFNASILENIRYARSDASFAEVVAAAKAANAHDFIIHKEEGYDTIIGQGGSGLSGGERQRISIARAVLIDPKVLILDEATSALDSETERAIQDAIAELVKGRTTIAIAHRLSTLRNADRLVVVNNGQIVEVGTHQELLEKDGEFAKLVRLQQENNQVKVEV